MTTNKVQYTLKEFNLAKNELISELLSNIRADSLPGIGKNSFYAENKFKKYENSYHNSSYEYLSEILYKFTKSTNDEWVKKISFIIYGIIKGYYVGINNIHESEPCELLFNKKDYSEAIFEVQAVMNYGPFVNTIVGNMITNLLFIEVHNDENICHYLPSELTAEVCEIID